MLILGIETSCDETAVAVVKNGRQILSNVVYSQIALHQKTGGVVPEVAAREHVTKIMPVLEQALSEAKITLQDVNAIAVTAGPGLLSSLLIGVNAAMTLAVVLKKPLVPVNHVEGHIYANWLKVRDLRSVAEAQKNAANAPKFPIAVLTVSGGHNELLIMRGRGDYQFLGATLDDAAGEAFDKVARLLGLSYPGGPAIQKAAEKGKLGRYSLPRPFLKNWDFSFSGLKTAVLYLTKKHSAKMKLKQFVADVAAEFQESVCEVLATKLMNAAKEFKVKEVHLAGGVSANSHLREWAQKLLSRGIKLRFCEKISLCTDNAAMIAAAGYFKFKKNPKAYKKWVPIIANPSLELS